MDQLKEMGEFVRSASSTIEAPVVRRLKEAFASTAQDQQSRSRPAASAPRDGASSPAAPGSAVGGPAQPGADARADGAPPVAGGNGAAAGTVPGSAPSAVSDAATAAGAAAAPAVASPSQPGSGCGRRRGPPAAAGALDARIAARSDTRGSPIRTEDSGPGRRSPARPRTAEDACHPRGLQESGDRSGASLRAPARHAWHPAPGTPEPPGRPERSGCLRGPAVHAAAPGTRRAPAGISPAVRPGRASVPAGRVPVRGLVTTRSARPRPAWARLLRPGPRVPFPASRVVPASGPTAPAAQGARVVPVPAGADQEARVVQAARVVPVRAGSPVHAPAVPGRAR